MQLTREEAFKLNEKLTESEMHFNQIQTENRKLASIWLLSTFGGIGFALLNKAALPFSQEFIISLIGFAGSLGIIVLWNLDQGVYQRLLDANFIEGLKLEEQLPELPQVRHNMMKLHADRGVQPRVNWFYNVPLFVLLLLATWHLNKVIELTGWQVWLYWVGSALIYGMISYYIRNETTVRFKKKLNG